MAEARHSTNLMSERNFLKQLRVELEMELRDELELGRNRSLRRELGETLDEVIADSFEDLLRDNVTRVRTRVAERIRPRIEELKTRKAAIEHERIFQRLNLSLRIQHGVMAISVILLILTGLPLKFPDVPLFVSLMEFLGGIDNSTYLHRIAATGLIFVSLWHLVYIIAFRSGRRDFILMIPTPKDFTDFIQMMKYYMGKSDKKPQFGRFSYVEKFDYWAVYWGCVIMIGTGALLWSSEITFSMFPKYIYDIAKEVHSDEALLATLAIVIWHFYNVHFNPDRFPGSTVWLHGRLTEHEMLEEHPLELEEILAAERAERDSNAEES